jgi:glycosyltransferase involved in cell wall biosynthesis
MARWLIVGDSPSHVVGRLAQGLAAAHPELVELVYSHGTPSFHLLRLIRRFDGVFWADQVRSRSLAWFVDRPQVVWVHHVTDDLRRTTQRLLNWSDGVVTSSLSWQQELRTMTGQEVRLLPYFLPDAWRAQEDAAVARAALGIPADLFIVGYSGKATADRSGRKGTDVLAAVLDSLRELNGVGALLIGPGWETLCDAAARRGLPVHHRVFQTADETRIAYAAMNVLLITSRIEGGPCTLLEAMSQGIPAVTTNVGHVPELVRSGENGWIVASEPGSFVEVLRDLKERGVPGAVRAAARDTAATRMASAVLPRIGLDRVIQDAAASFHSRRGRLHRVMRGALAHLGRAAMVFAR